MNAQITPRVDLADPTLFGNDAAEDEAQDVFDAYFVERDEIRDFVEPAHRLRVLRAYRGEGKSAILRMAHASLSGCDCISVRTTGASLTPDVSGRDPGVWTKAWTRSIFSQLACEIGATIGMAWSDDAMALVEESERNGFRARSFTSSVLDRLKADKIPQRQTIGTANPEKTIERWMKGRPHLWLFVDDIDENFQNTPEFRCKVASFFSACRQIVNRVPEVHVRAGIRPNIWSILRSDAESLSKVEQYVLDIRWDMPLMRSILAMRIRGYLERTGQKTTIETYLSQKKAVCEERLIALAFEDQMQWGYNRDEGRPILRPPHVVMSTLSRLRPRWMIELAKTASQTVTGSSKLITKADIMSVLDKFGRQRIEDLSAEFQSECPQVREIINAFADGSEDYTTGDLHTAIDARVLQGIPVTLASVGKVTRPTQVAAFLYEIGFLTAREELPDGKYKHHTFSEEPSLLHSRTNIDRGMSWEIHPVFRQALGLRTSSGQKKQPPRQKHRKSGRRR